MEEVSLGWKVGPHSFWTASTHGFSLETFVVEIIHFFFIFIVEWKLELPNFVFKIRSPLSLSVLGDQDGPIMCPPGGNPQARHHFSPF